MDRQAPPCVGASPVSLSSPQLPAAIPTYPCYRVAGMRSIDRLSAEGQRLWEYDLMCKTGEAAFNQRGLRLPHHYSHVRLGCAFRDLD